MNKKEQQTMELLKFYHNSPKCNAHSYKPP